MPLTISQAITELAGGHTRRLLRDAEKVAAPSGSNWYGLALPSRRAESVVIDKTAGTITVLMEGLATPDVINYVETATSMTFTWPDEFETTVTIG